MWATARRLTTPRRPSNRFFAQLLASSPVNLPPTNESLESDGHPSSKTAPTCDELALTALPKIIKFDVLARCGDEIWIENEGQIYRLRKTRQGKLILTK